MIYQIQRKNYKKVSLKIKLNNKLYLSLNNNLIMKENKITKSLNKLQN